jgi:hypothetical protein
VKRCMLLSLLELAGISSTTTTSRSESNLHVRPSLMLAPLTERLT